MRAGPRRGYLLDAQVLAAGDEGREAAVLAGRDAPVAEVAAVERLPGRRVGPRHLDPHEQQHDGQQDERRDGDEDGLDVAAHARP